MKRLAIALAALTLLTARQAHAQAAPGNSCSTTGNWTDSMTSAGSGVFNGMFCNGGTFSGVISFQSTGNVGIGTTSPKAMLDVAGEIRTTGNTLTCSSSTTGAIRYDSSTKAFDYCGGSTPTWTAFNSGGSASAAGSTGQVQVNNNGVLYASSGLTFNSTSGALTASGSVYAFGSSDYTGLYAGTSPANGYFAWRSALNRIDIGTTGWSYPVYLDGSTLALQSQSGGSVGIGTTSPGALLDLGTAGVTLGTERLEGSTSGYVQLQPAAAAGSWTMTLPSSAGSNRQYLQTNGSGVTSWAAVDAAGLVGAARLAKMSVTSASSSATFTADQIFVATALNGTAYSLPSYSQTINLATTGAGGMDTGTAPASGFVSLYAIYNPTLPATSILACNVTTSPGSIYGGSNMPSGYTASALIGILPTNSSKQFVPGLTLDRRFAYKTYVNIFTGTSGKSSLTSQSIAAGVPSAARTADVALAATAAGSTYIVAISGDSTGTGAYPVSGYSSSTAQPMPGGISSSTYGGIVTIRDVPIITAQTVYWEEPEVNSDSMFVLGYSF